MSEDWLWSGEGEPSEEEARLVRMLAGHHYRGALPALPRRRIRWQIMALAAAAVLVTLSTGGIVLGQALLAADPEPEPAPVPAPVPSPESMPESESMPEPRPQGWSFSFTYSRYEDYRGVPWRATRAAAPPPGALLHGVLEAAKQGDCALALARQEEAMAVSKDYAALYLDVADCMTQMLWGWVRLEASTLSELEALLLRLTGPQPPGDWAAPATGGMELLLAEVARPGEDNLLREVLYDHHGESNLVGELGNLLRFEAEAAHALSTLPAEWRSPETDQWWARRVYITRAGLAAWYGYSLRMHHSELHAGVDAALAASLEADPLPEVVVAAARAEVAEYPLDPSTALVVLYPEYSGRRAALRCDDEQSVRALEAGRVALPWPGEGDCSLHMGSKAEVEGGLRGPGVLLCQHDGSWRNPVECHYVEEDAP